MDISNAKFFLLSADGASPQKLQLSGVSDKVVFLNHENAKPEPSPRKAQNSSNDCTGGAATSTEAHEVPENAAVATVNVLNYDENVVKDCGYFWGLDVQQIEKQIISNGDYCDHVECWKYANSKGGITPKALKYYNCYLIRECAKLGHLGVLNYLCENEFGGEKLTIADIRSLDNAALRWAAQSGHLDVVKYLCESEFGGEKLTIADIRSENNQALQWAAWDGHLEVLKYLCESEFGGEKLTIADIRSQDNQALCCAARDGHLDVVKYLCESEFGGEKLTIADIRSQDNEALRWAARDGRLDVVKYLCESEFGGEKLTIADIRSEDNYALRWAARYGLLDIVRYLLNKVLIRVVE